MIDTIDKINAIDTPYSTVNHAHVIAAAGVETVIRYVSPNTPKFPQKRLTLAEIEGLHSVGIAVGAVYERLDTAASINGQGDAHGQEAASLLTSYKWPLGAACYFAFDWDASWDEYSNVIRPYLRAVRGVVIPAGYLVDVYGSGLVCEWAVNDGLAHEGWLSMSPDWGGHQMYESKAAIVQTVGGKVDGLDVDLNVVRLPLGQAGFWVAETA